MLNIVLSGVRASLMHTKMSEVAHHKFPWFPVVEREREIERERERDPRRTVGQKTYSRCVTNIHPRKSYTLTIQTCL